MQIDKFLIGCAVTTVVATALGGLIAGPLGLLIGFGVGLIAGPLVVFGVGAFIGLIGLLIESFFTDGQEMNAEMPEENAPDIVPSYRKISESTRGEKMDLLPPENKSTEQSFFAGLFKKFLPTFSTSLTADVPSHGPS